MKQILTLVFLVCLAERTLSQDALLNMLMMRNLFRPQMDPNMAQGPNAYHGVEGQPGQQSAADGMGMSQRSNMMRRIMMPLMMGQDLSDPMTLMMMMGM